MVNFMLYVFYHDFLCKLKEREWGQKRRKEEGEERSGRLWTDKRGGRSCLMADADGEMVLQHWDQVSFPPPPAQLSSTLQGSSFSGLILKLRLLQPHPSRPKFSQKEQVSQQKCSSSLWLDQLRSPPHHLRTRQSGGIVRHCSFWVESCVLLLMLGAELTPPRSSQTKSQTEMFPGGN